MIGSFFTRGLVMLLGYAYPAYECFKTVEKNKPDIAQLRFWCQYWILVALLTVCERIGDAFISWVPMYSEAKLAFFIYLWYPKTKGTTYVYDSFFRPYVAKHETEIDRNLLELRAKAGDIAVTYWQRAASYGQTRVFEILQYIASQSVTAPRPSQPQANRQASAISQPPSSTSSTSSPEEEGEAAGVVGPSQADPGANVTVNAQKSTVQETAAAPPTTEPASKSTETRAEAMQIEEVAPSLTTENANPPSQETVVEETSFRFTRGRLRKTRSNS